MSAVAHTRVVGATPAAVWKRLADFGRIVEWADAVDHSSLMTETSEGVGTSRRIHAGSNVLLENVIVWEPDSCLSYEFEGLPPIVAKAVNTWTLEAVGDRTRVELTVEVTPGPRPPMRLAARAVANKMGAVNKTLLQDLVAAVERGDA